MFFQVSGHTNLHAQGGVPPPPALQKGTPSTPGSSSNTSNSANEPQNSIAANSGNSETSSPPSAAAASVLTSLASVASASHSAASLVTSSCFTPSSGFSPTGLSSRDFRDFGALSGISSAARHHSTLDRYPYLSQVNQTS